MTTVLLWLLVGSIAGNFMWIMRELEKDLSLSKSKINEYCHGVIYGLLMGPFAAIHVFLLANKINKGFDDDE